LAASKVVSGLSSREDGVTPGLPKPISSKKQAGADCKTDETDETSKNNMDETVATELDRNGR
jgi:hypothetical protein